MEDLRALKQMRVRLHMRHQQAAHVSSKSVSRGRGALRAGSQTTQITAGTPKAKAITDQHTSKAHASSARPCKRVNRRAEQKPKRSRSAASKR